MADNTEGQSQLSNKDNDQDYKFDTEEMSHAYHLLSNAEERKVKEIQEENVHYILEGPCDLQDYEDIDNKEDNEKVYIPCLRGPKRTKTNWRGIKK